MLIDLMLVDKQHDETNNQNQQDLACVRGCVRVCKKLVVSAQAARGGVQDSKQRERWSKRYCVFSRGIFAF